MMITVHGLPINVKYPDLKTLIKRECKISEFNLDSLVLEKNGKKKVRIWLADEKKGNHVIKCLNGYRLAGHILQVLDVDKSMEFQSQNQNTYSMNQPRQNTWSNQTQWKNIQQQQQNTYNYSQLNSYDPAKKANQQTKSRFDQSTSTLGRPTSQIFSISPKIVANSNTQASQKFLRSIETIHTDQNVTGRHESFDSSQDRPTAIIKDHYYDRQYTSRQSGGHHQEQQFWGQQVVPKSTLFSHNERNSYGHSQDRGESMKDIVKEPFKEIQKAYAQGRSHDIHTQSRRYSPTNGPLSPSVRPVSLSNRHVSANERFLSPCDRSISPRDRRYSPNERRSSIYRHRSMSPSEKVALPSYEKTPTDRRVLQPGRRISPFARTEMLSQSQSTKPPDLVDKRLSPSRRQISPERKMFSTERNAHGRRISPPKRKQTMNERNVPEKRDSMRQMSPFKGSGAERYSKTRNFEDSRSIKQVRPAYDSVSDSNQATYTGDFRPNDSYQYSSKSHEERTDSWSKIIIEHNKGYVEDRKDKGRMTRFEPAKSIDHPREIEEEMKRSISRNRESRSPRRDRSPLRDRFKRHSPSPRSPRRSWALEKRSSPEDTEIPLQPSWPGQDANRLKNIREKREHYPQRVEDNRGISWDMNKYEPIDDERREIHKIADDRRPIERSLVTVRKDLDQWKAIENDSPKRSPPRYKPEENERALRRKEIESRFEGLRAQNNDRRSCLDRREFEEPRRDEERRFESNFTDAAEFAKLKEELTRRIEKKSEILKKQEELQKEIEDIYKRATDFTNKAEYIKGERKQDDYQEHRRRDDYDSKEFNLPTMSRLTRDRSYDRVESRKKGNSETPDVPKTDKILVKRHKASETIAEKIFDKFGGMLRKDIGNCIKNKLKFVISKTLSKMYGEDDVSFIEMIIKFNSKHSTKDEKDMYDSVVASFPRQFWNLKRPATDKLSEVQSKISKLSPVSHIDKDIERSQNYQTPAWEYQYATQYVSQSTPQYITQLPTYVPEYKNVPLETDSLFLCKENLQAINGYEADLIKDYIVNKMIEVSQTGQSWSPDFTLKGLQSPYRYEVMTRDAESRIWLLSLDFKQFTHFDILVYTNEELYYERAAIWLPGHSRSRIEPLEKLKLQNRFLDNVNVGKWKLVKKIVTTRGIRLYVDMPPSCARALQNHGRTLSYELQKVEVFLKAMAVDKDAFDTGLKEQSVGNIVNVQNQMPSLPNNSKAIKFCIKGDKPLSLGIASKIKDSIIYHLFKYHQCGGSGRTDFTSYGFMSGYFGVLPENDESKRWLMSVELKYINKQCITVFGAEESRTRFVKMLIVWPGEKIRNPSMAFEKLRTSNQGVKGIYFNKWKRMKLDYDHAARTSTLEIEMDLDSIERISHLNYQLDYVVDGVERVVYVKSQYPNFTLTEIINKYKEENRDKYDVASMELSSGSETAEDVVCLD